MISRGRINSFLAVSDCPVFGSNLSGINIRVDKSFVESEKVLWLAFLSLAQKLVKIIVRHNFKESNKLELQLTVHYLEGCRSSRLRCLWNLNVWNIIAAVGHTDDEKRNRRNKRWCFVMTVIAGAALILLLIFLVVIIVTSLSLHSKSNYL